MTSTVTDYLSQYLTEEDACSFPILKKTITRDSSSGSILLRAIKEKYSFMESMASHAFYDSYHDVYDLCGEGLASKICHHAFDSKFYHKALLNNENTLMLSDETPGYTMETHYKALNNKLNYTHYNNDAQVTSDLFFPGIRYLSENTIVFEMPPSNKNISYIEAFRDSDSSEDQEREYQEYYVPMPWQVYVAVFDPNTMRLSEVQMYFTKTPLTSFDQALYLPPMLNFYSDGTLCRPFMSSMDDVEKYPQTVSGIIASAYDWVWNSGYNFDITETMSEYIISKKFNSLISNSNLPKQELDYIAATLNTLKYSSNNLSPSYVSCLFKLWQSVPINNILNCDWISFCTKAAFFSYEYSYFTEGNFNIVSDWVRANLNLTLVSDYDGDPDEESEEDYCERNEGCISSRDLLESVDYRKWAFNQMHNKYCNVVDAYKIAQSKIAKHPSVFSKNSSSYQAFNNFIERQFNNISSAIISS